MKPNTLAIHAGQTPDPATGSCAVPIHLTTAFAYKDVEYARTLFTLETAGHIYTRLSNPTTSVFEDRMAALDGGVGAVAFSSGQHAIAVAIFNLAKCGEHIVASKGVYGGTFSLFHNTLKKFGIEVTQVDMADPENIAKAVRPNTRAVFYEVLANPKNEVLDYPRIAEVAHKHGLPVIADNTVLSQVLFKPFDYGVDIAAYSATKMIGGHGTCMGGVLVDSGNFDWGKEPQRWPQFTEPDPQYRGVNFYERFGKACFAVTCRTNWLRDLGGCLSPMNSFQLLQGLETLHLRAPRHSENALAVALWL